MRIRVSDGWQLGDEQGNLYQPGEVFDAGKEDAERWVAAGMATKAVSGSKNKAVTTSANKADEPADG